MKKEKLENSIFYGSIVLGVIWITFTVVGALYLYFNSQMQEIGEMLEEVLDRDEDEIIKEIDIQIIKNML